MLLPGNQMYIYKRENAETTEKELAFSIKMPENSLLKASSIN
jgi:hypothetical protein